MFLDIMGVHVMSKLGIFGRFCQVWLRGIHHQDLESILEFMYLGVATFYQERMKLCRF